ncbi:MAG: MFS transporter, partial [Thermomicrobiales bacterium]
ASFATISRAETGRASTLSSVQRQIGSATGVAVLSTVLAAVGPVVYTASGAARPNLDAYHAAFLTAAGFALLGALLALIVPDRDAAATMQVRGRREPAQRALTDAPLAEGD